MNQDTQELARLRAAFTAPAEAAPAPQSCPAPEAVWSAVRGELPPQELRRVVDHVASCASCAEDWRLAVELEREAAAAPAVTAPGRVIAGRFGRWRSFTAAAAIAAGLLVAVGVYREGTMPNAPSTYREAGGTEIRSLLPEGKPLPRQDAVLRWTAVPGAASYDVTVSTEDLLHQVADAQGQTAAELRLPPDTLQGLPSGAKLVWRVDAVFPDGHHVTSGTFVTPLQ